MNKYTRRGQAIKLLGLDSGPAKIEVKAVHKMGQVVLVVGKVAIGLSTDAAEELADELAAEAEEIRRVAAQKVA